MMIELSEIETRYLSTMQRGCGYDAKPSEWRNAEKRRAIERLVQLGLARKTAGAAWNKAGCYVITETGKSYQIKDPKEGGPESK